MLLRGPIALVLTLLALLALPVAPAWAQSGGWEFPSAASYSPGAGDNAKMLGSENAPGSAITINLPSPATVGNTWGMGFETANGRGVIINVSGGGVFIFAGQKTLTSLTMPSNANYEVVQLASDGTNFRLMSATKTTAQQNGLVPTGPGGWTYLFATGYTMSAQDNGTVISGGKAGGPVTVTLPSAALVPNGWSASFNADTNPITIQPPGGSNLILLGGTAVASYVLPVANFTEVTFDGSNFRLVAVTPPVLLASQFGVSLTNSDVVNTTDLNNMTATAYATGLDWRVDVVGEIPMDGMTAYSGSNGSFAAGAWLLMVTPNAAAPFGFQTLLSPGAAPGSLPFDISELKDIAVDMNRVPGAGIMIQGMNHGRIIHPQWKNISIQSYTYNDGIASGGYPSAGLDMKGVSTTGNGPWWDQIINPVADLRTFLRPTSCTSTNVLNYTQTPRGGIFDTEGTVYIVDATTSGALPAGTTVTSHTSTTVTVSTNCTSVIANDELILTTAARNILINNTQGFGRTNPSPLIFVGGQLNGAAINIDDFIGGRNQFINMDVSEGGYGIRVGGDGLAVSSDLISLAYGEAESIAKIVLTSDANATIITDLGGSSGTSTEVIDQGTSNIYPGHFYIGSTANGASNVAITPDTGSLGENGLRFRTDNTNDGAGFGCMPNGTGACTLKLYGNDDVTGTNLEWGQIYVDPATDFLDITGRQQGTGVAPTQLHLFLDLYINSMDTISSGSKAVCYNSSTGEIEKSASTTCPP